jgi:hypothetical protein
MSRSVFWALVRKDLFLMRGFIIAMLVVGLGSWALMGQGGKAFAVGGLLFLTANVAGAIFIAVYSMQAERKEQARLFALSLPISGVRYYLSKLASGYLSFGIPWLVLTTVGLLGILLNEQGDRGMLVYGILIQCFVLAQFSVVMAAMFVSTSDAMSGIVILAVNIGFSLFMIQINQPEIIGPWKSDAIVWTPFARHMLAGELVAMVLALGIAVYILSRSRDHI